MEHKRINGRNWANLVVASGIYLETKKSIVDSLNVFPVPDGDTGTNMSLTMASASKAILEKQDENIGTAAKTISYGALMGARGNSGVILSQLFAGFAKAVEGLTELETKELAGAIDLAVQTAYQAVMNPVEGTILTVSREAARAANKEVEKSECSIESVLEAAYLGAVKALEKTPEQLTVLKQAGVVDAGGQGFVYILQGMLNELRGEETLSGVQFNEERKPEKTKSESSTGETLEFQYCTEFILKKKESPLDLEDIRSFILDKGDCVLVVGNSETGKIHIHTNNPGKVIEYCSQAGSLHEIEIHNMYEQSLEMQMKAKDVKHLGVISVAVGTGFAEIFKSLGVDLIIKGGQTMNPSTQDFVEAIENIMAEEVIILPNNGNIIMAAEQAVTIASKPCRVVSTRTITQGIAALMAFNLENDLKYNKTKMEEACKRIITLEVTYAVRDSQYNGLNIEKGQILGIVDGKLTVTGSQTASVVEKLIEDNLKQKHELVTVYYGEDVKENEAKKVVEDLSQRFPAIDFELHFGGQPLYYYLISLE